MHTYLDSHIDRWHFLIFLAAIESMFSYKETKDKLSFNINIEGTAIESYRRMLCGCILPFLEASHHRLSNRNWIWF